MSLFTRGKVFLWSDKASYIGYEAGTVSIVVDSTVVQTYTSTGTTEIVTAANVLTAAENGKTLILDNVTGFQTTLPPMAAGLSFTFGSSTNEVTGSNHTIISDAGDVNTMFGAVSCGGVVVLVDTHDTLTLTADLWIAGDTITLTCDGNAWYVTGVTGITLAVASA